MKKSNTKAAYKADKECGGLHNTRVSFVTWTRYLWYVDNHRTDTV